MYVYADVQIINYTVSKSEMENPISEINTPFRGQGGTILDKIVIRKKEEIALAKQQVSIAQLEAAEFFDRQPYSFREFLLDPARTGIIAEFKRR